MRPTLARAESHNVAEITAALPHFGHIKRYWCSKHQKVVATLLPGDYYVTRHDELIFTVLGSCVSACVRERQLGIGGMNHFMLPLEERGKSCRWGGDVPSAVTRYGNVAMEHLIDDILQFGGLRANLEFKVIGGGKLLDVDLGVGERNASFVLEYLKAENFVLAASDLGDRCARKLYYCPATGAVRVKRLTSTIRAAMPEKK